MNQTPGCDREHSFRKPGEAPPLPADARAFVCLWDASSRRACRWTRSLRCSAELAQAIELRAIPRWGFGLLRVHLDRGWRSAQKETAHPPDAIVAASPRSSWEIALDRTKLRP